MYIMLIDVSSLFAIQGKVTAPSNVPPNQERISILAGQVHFGANRQQHFGCDMAQREFGEDGNFQLRPKPSDHAQQLKPFVVRHQFVARELAQDNRFLLG